MNDLTTADAIVSGIMIVVCMVALWATRGKGEGVE